MNIQQNVSLAAHSTMRLGGVAAYLCEVTSREEVAEAVNWAREHSVPVMMIGSGSNIVWRDEGFPGLVVVNKIMGYADVAENETDHLLTIGAGEMWDSVVERSVQAGLTGIEALSMIPGTAGATPVQNVGAYGQRISRVLTAVEAYDTQTKNFITLRDQDCGFAYRTSRFKAADKGRFFITAITLHLTHGNPKPPFYEALQAYFDQHHIHAYTPAVVREAVIAIRRVKLPDPSVVANNGSFFANPIVTEAEAARLKADFPNMPQWPGDDGMVKIPAGWLIEQVGLKGFHDRETGMATWPNHALVLVNEHAKSSADLLKFKQKIIDAVQATFGITLEQEPELLP